MTEMPNERRPEKAKTNDQSLKRSQMIAENVREWKMKGKLYCTKNNDFYANGKSNDQGYTHNFLSYHQDTYCRNKHY